MNILDIRSVVRRVIWETDPAAVTPAHAVAIRFARVVYVIGRDLVEGQLTLRAMSLVYTTLLSMVPVLAISFSVLKAFGVQDVLEPMLLRFLEPLGQQGVEVTQQIVGFIGNMKVGVLGAVGLGLLIYTVISLMQKVERAFNFIWHVKRPRPLAQRFSDYLSVVLVGPVLLFSALGISATVRSNWLVEKLAAIEPFGTAIEVAGRLIPFFMIIGAFSFFYIFITNTKIRLSSAFVGGLAAGVMWQITGVIFAAVVVNSAKYAAIYSAFATLIIFMIWLHVSWLILLVGSSIAFYHQNPAYRSEKRGEIQLSSRLKEAIALHIVQLVGNGLYRGDLGWSDESLARKLRMPMEAVLDVLLALEGAGLLKRTDDDPAVYVPARALDTTSVKEVYDAVRAYGERVNLTLRRLPHHAGVQGVAGAVESAMASVLEKRTLKDLALDGEAMPTAADHRRDG